MGSYKGVVGAILAEPFTGKTLAVQPWTFESTGIGPSSFLSTPLGTNSPKAPISMYGHYTGTNLLADT